MIKNTIAGLVVLVLLGGGYLLMRPDATPMPPVGGSGPIGNVLAEFFAGFQVTDNYASTTPGAATLSAREAAGFSTVSFYPNIAAVTLTLPASTTLGALLGPGVGTMKRVCYYNATTTAAITITLASGAGVDLEVASSSILDNAPALTILPDASACIEYQKKSSASVTAANRNDISARLIRFVDGD